MGACRKQNVLHLHGELMKVRAIDDETKVYELKPDALTATPDTVIDGHRVRPHIVFFQEAVPNIEPAIELAQEADVFVVIGTSLNVYPAASLLHFVRERCACLLHRSQSGRCAAGCYGA